MWGTSSPDDKLTGDLVNVIETTQIGGRRSNRLTAGNLSPDNFGLLQHNRHKADLANCLPTRPLSGRSGHSLPLPGVLHHARAGAQHDDPRSALGAHVLCFELSDECGETR